MAYGIGANGEQGSGPSDATRRGLLHLPDGQPTLYTAHT